LSPFSCCGVVCFLALKRRERERKEKRREGRRKKEKEEGTRNKVKEGERR